MDPIDALILIGVILARLLVPLLIPRFPLPAIIAALVIDGVDQTIFQRFTNLDLAGYQSYDKALDIYYLMIAYMATMRNWDNLFAVKIARFLFIFRLIGVALFELTYTGDGPRWMMLIFPNVFEYFFIFYETIRLRWDPAKLSNKVFIYGVAFIWLFIKLPQEYWIHIAQMDVTDLLKEHIFGVPTSAGIAEIVTTNLWLLPAIPLILAGIWLLAQKLRYKLPPAEFQLRLRASVDQQIVDAAHQTVKLRTTLRSYFNASFLEKLVLISLIVTIFSQILPGMQTSNTEMILIVFTLVIANTVLSFVTGKHKLTIASTIRDFLGNLTVNMSFVVLGIIFLQDESRTFSISYAMFFLFLLSIMITFYDRFRPVYEGKVIQHGQRN